MSNIQDNLERDRAYIALLRNAGADVAAPHTEPAATVGFFAAGMEPWTAGKTYKDQYSLMTYEGAVWFTRQSNVLAQAHQPPGSTGMESVYGVRPEPDLYGVFPYTYNMAAVAGMRVREGNAVYRCIEDIQLLIWPPSQVSRYFELEDEA